MFILFQEVNMFFKVFVLVNHNNPASHCQTVMIALAYGFLYFDSSAPPCWSD